LSIAFYRSIYELWGQGKCHEDLKEDLKQLPKEFVVSIQILERLKKHYTYRLCRD